MFLKNFKIFIKKRAVLQQKFTVQVTSLADCDDITRFDGTKIARISTVERQSQLIPCGLPTYLTYLPYLPYLPYLQYITYLTYLTCLRSSLVVRASDCFFLFNPISYFYSHAFHFWPITNKINMLPMHQLKRSRVRSQHRLAQSNLRGGRWSSVEYSVTTTKNPPKNI